MSFRCPLAECSFPVAVAFFHSPRSFVLKSTGALLEFRSLHTSMQVALFSVQLPVAVMGLPHGECCPAARSRMLPTDFSFCLHLIPVSSELNRNTSLLIIRCSFPPIDRLGFNIRMEDTGNTNGVNKPAIRPSLTSTSGLGDCEGIFRLIGEYGRDPLGLCGQVTTFSEKQDEPGHVSNVDVEADDGVEWPVSWMTENFACKILKE